MDEEQAGDRTPGEPATPHSATPEPEPETPEPGTATPETPEPVADESVAAEPETTEPVAEEPAPPRNLVALVGVIVAVVAFGFAAHSRDGAIGGVLAMVIGAIGLQRAVRTDTGVALALLAIVLGLVAVGYSTLASY